MDLAQFGEKQPDINKCMLEIILIYNSILNTIDILLALTSKRIKSSER